MRDIKFKAWDTVNNVMKDWNYVASQFDLTDLFGNSRFVPLQFTGLKDKKGIEIYEGDVFEWNNMKGVVKYGDGCFLFNTRNLSMTMYSHSSSEFTIIGNIHTNPELIK